MTFAWGSLSGELRLEISSDPTFTRVDVASERVSGRSRFSRDGFVPGKKYFARLVHPAGVTNVLAFVL